MTMNVTYRGPEDCPDVIPVFPLSGALLLPRGQLPLNIFEPRYLAMVDEALRTNRIIGMGQLDAADGVLGGLPADAKDPLVAQARAALALAREATPVEDLEGLRAKVDASPDDHAARFELAGGLMARGDRDGAADALLEIIRRDRGWQDGAARDRLLKLFDAVGLEDPWVMGVRRRLSTILFS